MDDDGELDGDGLLNKFSDGESEFIKSKDDLFSATDEVGETLNGLLFKEDGDEEV